MIWVGTSGNSEVCKIPLLRAACLVAMLCFAVSSLAFAQGDPLKPSNMPTIDTNCADYPANVWVTGSLFKLRQDSGTPPTCPGSYANKWITVYGTQNEFVDFQVHWHDTGSGTTGLKITVSNFVQTTPTSSTINCSTLGQCVVYREAYVNVQGTPTNTSSSRAWNTFYGVVGKYPDILVPAVDPYWGQTTNAWPFNVAAGNNQSAWIDVLVPQTAPSGYYSGTVTVQTGCPSSCTTVTTLPIILGVWQWPSSGHMPSTPTLTMLGAATGWSYQALCTQMYAPGATSINQAACGTYPGGGGSPDTANLYVVKDAELVMKDHRYPSGAHGDISVTTGSFSAYNALEGPILNGTCNLHNGVATTCPVLPGSKDNAIDMGFRNEAGSAAIWSNFYSNFQTQGWLPDLYNYLCDETSCTSTSYGYGAAMHGYISPGIPNLATTTWGALNTAGALNDIDWIVDSTENFQNIGGSTENPANYQSWLTGSADGIARKWLSYFACGQTGTCSDGSPGPAPAGWTFATYANFSADGLPVAHRVMEWQTYLHGQGGELYYADDICDYPSYYSQCVPSGVAYDPWSGIYYSGGWGDGTRLYTGSVVAGSVNYMGSGVTIPLILPSIRLTDARDGVQDYEYLHVLTQNGQGTLAMNAVTSWVTDNYTFNVNPTAPQYGFASDITDARMALGTAMHQLTYPVVLLPPPALTGTLQ